MRHLARIILISRVRARPVSLHSSRSYLSCLNKSNPWHRGTISFHPGYTRLTVVDFAREQRKCLSALTTVLTPPAVFVGLVIALWTYKCLMMVLFQNKIIYMPSMPPFSRREKISDYAKECLPVTWRQQNIKSSDGTKLALCVGSVASPVDRSERVSNDQQVIIVYFQGNASSMPPRLPGLSKVLRSLTEKDPTSFYTIVALSYRGFWQSSGRPVQSGIEKDASATLQWASETFELYKSKRKLVVWGQSIGAGVATATADTWTRMAHRPCNIAGLILETPFVSIPRMLVTLYPQKWLPYRYLSPFLVNWWDSETALRNIHRRNALPPVLLVTAENDEIVPEEQVSELRALCQELQSDFKHKEVPGALHTEVLSRAAGRQSIVEFLLNSSSRKALKG